MNDFTQAERIYGLTVDPIKSEEEAAMRSNMAHSRLRLLCDKLFDCLVDEALLLEYSMKTKEVNGEQHEYIITGAAAVAESLKICHSILAEVVLRMEASMEMSMAERERNDG